MKCPKCKEHRFRHQRAKIVRDEQGKLFLFVGGLCPDCGVLTRVLKFADAPKQKKLWCRMKWIRMRVRDFTRKILSGFAATLEECG